MDLNGSAAGATCVKRFDVFIVVSFKMKLFDRTWFLCIHFLFFFPHRHDSLRSVWRQLTSCVPINGHHIWAVQWGCDSTCRGSIGGSRPRQPGEWEKDWRRNRHQSVSCSAWWGGWGIKPEDAPGVYVCVCVSMHIWLYTMNMQWWEAMGRKDLKSLCVYVGVS